MTGLSIAIQMDPIEAIAPKGDTTLALGLEAQKRGHDLFLYQPDHLALREETLLARGCQTRLMDDEKKWFEKGKEETRDLAERDLVLMRQDPPFNMAYITAAHLLETLDGRTLVINAPESVRNAPEKLSPLAFPHLTPPTVISQDREALLAFLEEEKEVILKPLYEAGGAGIVRARLSDGGGAALIDLLLAHQRTPIIAQKYLPAAKEGDTRILFLEGEPVASLKRVPKEGDYRANLHQGGQPRLAPMTAKEKTIADEVGAFLKARDLFFVGIDALDGFLIEINITSPTCVREVRNLGGADIAALFWDKIERRLKDGS